MVNLNYSFCIALQLLFWSCGAPVKNTPALHAERIDTLESTSNDSIVFQNDQFIIYRIDSTTFFKDQLQAKYQRDTIASLSNLDEVRRRLNGRVKFVSYLENGIGIDTLKEGNIIQRARFADGTIIEAGEKDSKIDFLEMSFVKYFPSEEVILLEGGHTSDQAIDLRRNKWDITEIGTLDYVYFSKNKKFRLNGLFEGQECSMYFIQKKVNDVYETYSILPLSLGDKGFDLCTLNSIFWNNDEDLFFRNFYYGETNDDRLGFFKLHIISDETK